MARFEYFNINPLGYTEPDCVIRAITLASGLPYEDIEEKLNLVGELYNCEKLCVACYRFLLDKYFQYERVSGEGMLVDEFADTYPVGTYILRMNGHLTCCIDNTIYDIWDCRFDGIVTDAWRVD